MKKIDAICEIVKRRVVPNQRLRRDVSNIAEKLLSRLAELAREQAIDSEIRIDGSVAKDTWLKDEADIDIFLRLPTTIPRDQLAGPILKMAEQAVYGYRTIRRFAEHPYVEAYLEGTTVNIVPCYRVEKGGWMSATDRTPFHTDYVKGRLSDEMKDEVRILKKFMKGIGTYGADIKTGGFSGMLCETLIVNYEAFKKLIEDAAKWRPQQIIDVEGYYRDRRDEIPDLFDETLVVVDPVDEGRNLAASITEARLWEFVAAAQAFVQTPSLNFFFPRKKPTLYPQVLRERTRNLLAIQFGRVEAVVDVLWGQLYKTESALRTFLRQLDFTAHRTACWSNESNRNIILLELESVILPKVKKHYGPEVYRIRECESFLAKHLWKADTVGGPWIDKNRWVVSKSRNIVEAKEALNQALRNGGASLGVGRKVSQSLAGGFRILMGNDILRLASSDEKFATFFRRFLEGRPAWLERAS